MSNSSGDLPLCADYAKSNKSSCKGCKEGIKMHSLRLAVMTQHIDGKIPSWYHSDCFWKNCRVKTVEHINGFDDLRPDDQQTIRKNVKAGGSGVSGMMRNPPVDEFSVEYSSSSRASCKGCGEKINKDALRISITDHDSRAGKMQGGVPAWYHAKCFFPKWEELEYFESGDKIPGFDDLKDVDKILLKKELKQRKRKSLDTSDDEVSPGKQPKLDNDEKEEAEVADEVENAKE